MHFQIFLPHKRGGDPALLIDVGLADFVAGAEFVDVGKGPTEEPGALVAWRKPGHVQIGYQPAKQTWLPAVPRASEDLAAGRYWIGFWNGNDSPCTPRDLARPYPQPGSTVRLGDGADWLLPAAKQLDSQMKLADDGTWRFEVQRRFHGFFLEYVKWFQFFATAEEGTQFSFGDAADFVLAGLRINYRLPAEAASQLELFSKETINAAMRAILGVSDGGGIDG